MTCENCVCRISLLAVGLWVALAGKGYSATIDGSTIAVSGLPNPISGNDYITVTLHGFSATNTSDVDVVVVGPTGAALVLLGGVGSTSPVGPFNITFDDTATSGVTPDLSSPGSFKPTQIGPIGSFPAPGPGLAYESPAPFGTSLLGNLNAAGVFTGLDLNGTWSLYAMDTVSGDRTEIANGWSLNITLPGMPGNVSTFTNRTAIVVPTVPEPGTLFLAAFGLASLAASDRKRRRWRVAHQTKYVGDRREIEL
ncbi:MAG TPA: PEP-CTERM sorting domain-containing protein [Pirellulales bacterium]|nr:PEP-CTERM sorting domain-containing protein [Pirellulales bacterium]